MTPGRETREKKRHSTALIPYSYYVCRIPMDFINVPMHWHEEFELNRIFSGRGEFLCGDAKFEVEEGDILMIPPNMLHAIYPWEGCELCYRALVFSPVLLGINSNDRCTNECVRPFVAGNVRMNVRIDRKSGSYAELGTITDRIFSCVHENSARMDLLIKSELMRFIWIMEQNGDVCFEEESESGYGDLVRPVLEYMAENFREDITVSELADIVHLSKSYFMRCFKAAAGISAIEHLSQLRINAVCKALLESEDAVADIAFRCGYSNLSNFNRQFLKKVGCSPKEYRNIKSMHRQRKK